MGGGVTSQHGPVIGDSPCVSFGSRGGGRQGLAIQHDRGNHTGSTALLALLGTHSNDPWTLSRKNGSKGVTDSILVRSHLSHPLDHITIVSVIPGITRRGSHWTLGSLEDGIQPCKGTSGSSNTHGEVIRNHTQPMDLASSHPDREVGRSIGNHRQGVAASHRRRNRLGNLVPTLDLEGKPHDIGVFITHRPIRPSLGTGDVEKMRERPIHSGTGKVDIGRVIRAISHDPPLQSLLVQGDIQGIVPMIKCLSYLPPIVGETSSSLGSKLPVHVQGSSDTGKQGGSLLAILAGDGSGGSGVEGHEVGPRSIHRGSVHRSTNQGTR